MTRKCSRHRRAQESPEPGRAGEPRRAQENPGEDRRALETQESSGEHRTAQESPREQMRASESSGGPRKARKGADVLLSI